MTNSLIEIRFIKFNSASKAYQTKLSPLAPGSCPSQGSTTTATLWCGRKVRPCVVPCLQVADGPSPDGSGRGGPTQVNGIFDRSMESARFKFGAARLAAHWYAEEKSEKSEPSEVCGRDPPCRGRNKKQYQ